MGIHHRPLQSRRTAPPIAIFLLAMAVGVGVLGSGPLDRSQASGDGVGTCKPFVVSNFHDQYGPHRFRAWNVKRSSHIRCSMTRKLIKAAYGAGPLKILRKVYGPGGSGRPTYWLRHGWRCSNGAGGASCFNAERPVFNAIEYDGIHLAVTAATG